MRYISILILLVFFSTNIFAECDWKDIKREGDLFIYPQECHELVGSIIKENHLRKEQVDKLKEAIELKDVVISKTEQRVELWREASYKLEERVQKQQKWESVNKWVYFGTGIAVAILTAWANGKANQ